MRHMSDAAAEIVAAMRAETNTSGLAKIGTQTVPAIIASNQFNPEFVDGGISEGGTQTLIITKALLTDFSDTNKFPNGEPPKGTRTEVDGVVAEILSVHQVNDSFEIITGHFAANP